MSFLQFPKVQLMKTIDTAEILDFGGFKVTDNQELRHIRIYYFINGTLGGSEIMTLRVHSSTDTSLVYASSTAVTVSTFSTNNLGLVRFDFSRPNLNKNFTYNISLSIANYTRNGDTFYISVPYDFPTITYGPTNDNFTDHTLKAEFFGFK